MVISMALLTAGRCIARVATPSETVNDRLFMCPLLHFPPCSSSTPGARHCLRFAYVAIMPPANRRRKKRKCEAGRGVQFDWHGVGGSDDPTRPGLRVGGRGGDVSHDVGHGRRRGRTWR